MFNKDSIRIEVPQRLKKFLANPSPYVDKTIKDADKESLTILKTDIKAITHKKSGKLAGSIQIDLMGRKVYSKSPYARAYQLGIKNLVTGWFSLVASKYYRFFWIHLRKCTSNKPTPSIYTYLIHALGSPFVGLSGHLFNTLSI